MFNDECTVLHAARHSLQARILPHLSIRRLFERRPTAEDDSEGGDLLRAGPKSTAGRRRGRHEDESGRQRLPRSLAPWHTLPFMTKEVCPPDKPEWPEARVLVPMPARPRLSCVSRSNQDRPGYKQATWGRAPICVAMDMDTPRTGATSCFRHQPVRVGTVGAREGGGEGQQSARTGAAGGPQAAGPAKAPRQLAAPTLASAQGCRGAGRPGRSA